MRALLLTGNVAAGKTAVAVRLADEVADRGLPVAAIDLDWLAWAWFGPGPQIDRLDALIGANLAAILPNFAAAGVERVILARAVLRPETLTAIRRSVPLELVVRLTASPATLEARVRARDTGRQLEEHLRLIAAGDAPGLADAEVRNEGRPLAEVAREVLHLAGW